MIIGTQLRKLRDQQKKTTRDMAINIGVSQSTYTDWEHDKSSPSLKIYLKIADAFEVSPVRLMSYLVGETSNVLSENATEMAELKEKVENLSQYTMLLGEEKKLLMIKIDNLLDQINLRSGQ
jgi:transcriptional regulator with XRE-family HTH domain